MNTKKKDFPADLVDSLVKHESIIFFGGDILRTFQLTEEEFFPDQFVRHIAEQIEFPKESQISFFNVGEYAEEAFSKQWLNGKIKDAYENQINSFECPPLISLVSTKQRLLVTTWFDDYLFKILHSAGKKVNQIKQNTDLPYLEESSIASLVYLFGSANSPDTLITNSKDYESQFDSRNPLNQHIVGLLANSTLLFIGFTLSSWFDFEDFHNRLLQIAPDRHARTNYLILNEDPDLATKKRFRNRNLEIIVTNNIVKYISSIATKIQNRQNQVSRTTQVNSKRPEKPYKYLDYYSSDDKDIFFGREKEIEKIIGLVKGHKVTVIYGASGGGKTSLFEAGIGPALKADGFRLIRTRILPDPANAINTALKNKTTIVGQSGHWLKLTLDSMSSEYDENIVLVFDQFEEFFSDLSSEIQASFWSDVSSCINEINYTIRLVFVIRQESLYQFKNASPAISKPLDCTHCVNSLTSDEQLDVIKFPAEYYGNPWSDQLSNKLVEDFQIFKGETAHLSIVLTTLWEQGNNKESDFETYNKLGQVEGILGDYLWRAVKAMSNANEVEQILKCFVSPERRKSQVSIDDIIAEGQKKGDIFTPNEVKNICNQLIAARLVRHVSRENFYELSHDVLASTIAEKITDEEMLSKVAKRSIREARQNWLVIKRLPNPQEYNQLDQAASNAPLTDDDLLFLSLSAANSGKTPQKWLSKLLINDDLITKFYEICVKSDSLLAAHEFLRSMRKNYSSKYFNLLEDLSKSKFPSIILELNNLKQLLLENGYNDLNKLELSLPKLQVIIPKGEFIFGYEIKNDDIKSVIPKHQVYLDEFIIDRFLVTNIEYKRFVDSTGHPFPIHWIDGKIPFGLEYHPVTQVNWYDAALYAKWINKRLPTEAEWEKAAYWDSTTQRKSNYPWGDEFHHDFANYYKSGIGLTSPIGQFSPHGDSPSGVSDMAGNVFEWLLDDAVVPFIAFKSDYNPVHIIDGEHYPKMTRGGSYGGPETQLHGNYRDYSRLPYTKDDYVGFRCVTSSNSELRELMISLLNKIQK